MNTLGNLSGYSAYQASESSFYSSKEISSVNNEPQTSVADSTTSKNDDIEDTATISAEAQAKYEADKAQSDSSEQSSDSSTPETQSSTNSSIGADASKKLSPEQQQEVNKLKTTDTKVKAHEQAHLSAAAGISASAPTYDYQTGPDGKKYAVGGEVQVSFSESQDPQQNLKNAETMKAAALAPADPSSQDLSAANHADKLIQEAKQKIAQQKEAEQQSDKSDNTDKTSQDNTKDSSTDNSTETTGSLAAISGATTL